MAPKSVKPQGRGATAPTAKPAPKKAKKAAKKKAADTSPKRGYIRNLHNGAGGSRIDLTDGTRIQLEPRGQDGDLSIVSEEMAGDPMYLRNKDVIFEELTTEQGQEIISKQHINARVPRQTTMEMLTNEHGKPYEQVRASIAPSNTEQEIVVAQVTAGADGKNTEKNTELTRAPQTSQVLGPQEVQVPGSRAVHTPFNPDVMPGGLTTEQAQLFLQTPREERQALMEGFELEAYRAGLQVSVEPTEQA